MKTAVPYTTFDQINGAHSLRAAVPTGFVDYQARRCKGGRIAFFNYALAKEMGLIAKEHPETLLPELELKILETFSLTIINEYDLIHKVKYPACDLLPNRYMATRYLQLQHPNKQGKTSGDGRSIWNGEYQGSGGTLWDISSCGTGATQLSPATWIKNKFFKTGDPRVSYGCGKAAIDEGLSALFMSEVFHQNQVQTERVLAIIEFKDGSTINVRAHKCLLRPSHFFCHIKQGNYEDLKNLVEYYIRRQEKNHVWRDVPTKSLEERYRYFLDQVTQVFAKTAAQFEDDYIFCWLDWDGDNILMDGGIIDYGSVRQFGLFHNEYRYDDVHKYSTTISEQKQKARYIVQTFAQGMDFLLTRTKKNINSFHNCKANHNFDRHFEIAKDLNLMKKIGFKDEQGHLLATGHKTIIQEFRKAFSYFERTKSKEGIYEVADGITWDAIFCMRDILRDFPQLYLSRKQFLTDDEFIEIIKSSYAKPVDLQMTTYRRKYIQQFQEKYIQLVNAVACHYSQNFDKVLLDLSTRSAIINKYERITGDSVTLIVDKILKHRPKIRQDQINILLENFLSFQNFNPNKKVCPTPHDFKDKKLLHQVVNLVREYREGI